MNRHAYCPYRGTVRSGFATLLHRRGWFGADGGSPVAGMSAFLGHDVYGLYPRDKVR